MTGFVPLAPPPAEAQGASFRRLPIAFGPRFFVLLIVGFVWIAPAFAEPRFVFAMAGWDVLLLVAWAADARALPRPGELRIRREWLAPPSLAVESGVALTVLNQSDATVRVRVVDHVPRQLRAEPPERRLNVGPKGERSVEYLIRPAERGEAAVGDVYVRYQTPMRIAERWARAALAQTIVAYPNLEDARRQTARLIRSRRAELQKRSARHLGEGRTFESLRDFQRGDELRDICWTASARRGRLVTRLYDIERSQTLWIVVDAGRLMRTRVGALSKLDCAVNAALALSQVALYSGDRVGLLAYGRRIAQRLPAARGSRHLRQLVEQLAAVREAESESDHVQAAARLLTDQTRRCLIVWITDIAETAMTPEVVDAATQLTARHVVLVVVIGQPDLRVLADAGPANARHMYETAAAQEVLLRRERLLARLRERGALALESSSARLTPALVNAYLDIRHRSRP